MPAPLTGQVGSTTPLSNTPQVLGPPGVVAAYSIKAPVGNAHPVYIGPAGVTTTTGYNFDPGDKLEYERRNANGENQYQIPLSEIYVVGTAGDVLTWFASPRA